MKNNKHSLKVLKKDKQKELQLVQKNWKNIAYCKKQTYKLQQTAIRQNYMAIKLIAHPFKNILKELVTRYPQGISFIDKPTEDLQLAAVKGNEGAIQYIENPSEKILIAALEKNGGAIQYIENPTVKMQLIAINKNPFYLSYIKNPALMAQIVAVKNKMPDTIACIKNPSKKIQLLAIEQVLWSIRYIQNPDKETVLKIFQLTKNNILRNAEIQFSLNINKHTLMLYINDHDYAYKNQKKINILFGKISNMLFISKYLGD